MIAVTGANGQLGRLVLKHLSNITDTPVRALVRSPDQAQDLASGKVTLAKFDYDDPESLPAALEGVSRLLLISGSEVGKRVAQHKAVIDAAKSAGVGFITYTSLLNVPRSSLVLGAEHIETERLLTESGIPHAVLRNGWYVENYAGTIAAALEHGAVAGASGDGKTSIAGRDDYAEAAARIVSGDDLSTRALELAGDQAVSLADIAAEISRQSGRQIPSQNLAEEDYAGVLIGAGLPEGIAKAIADAGRGAAQGELFNGSTALNGILGRPTRTLANLVSEVLGTS
ncbi:SDR family oxidoreductase [uncultured Roseibium sp.]|uniref:SDR family oxidoreductase n=1 Tax=uncultured Roseibium sp. TaxID=1936171 RepID=UPI00261B55F7|nr:SDR family oxidoreductase [uncultured Roseibium sp.]